MGGELGGEHVHDGDTDFARFAAFIACDRHEAADALQQEVVAGQCRPFPTRSETRHRAVHNALVPGRDLLVADAEAGSRPRAEVLDHHVGTLGEQPGLTPAVLGAEVPGDAALVAVDAQVIGALVIDERRPEAAGVVTGTRTLDLDDVGAEIAEQHRGVGSGHHAREVGDEDAGERPAVSATTRVAGTRVAGTRHASSKASCSARMPVTEPGATSSPTS